MTAFAARIKLVGATKAVKVGVIAFNKAEAYTKVLERFPEAHIAHIQIIKLDNVKVKIKVGE